MAKSTLKKKPAVKKMANRMEAYRLWFEYYKVALLLKDANTSKLDSQVKGKIDKLKGAFLVRPTFYNSWEVTAATKFDPWWKSHSHLFEEQYIVRLLKDGEEKKDPDSIVVEIPLNKSVTELTKSVKSIIEDAHAVKRNISKKNKTQSNALYQLSKDSEPKLEILREMLTVFRDVYLKNPKLRGEDLVKAVHSFYKGRKNKIYNQIPDSLTDKYDPYGEHVKRNTRRYINNAAQVLVNVAAGEFPGKYGSNRD